MSDLDYAIRSAWVSYRLRHHDPLYSVHVYEQGSSSIYIYIYIYISKRPAARNVKRARSERDSKRIARNAGMCRDMFPNVTWNVISKRAFGICRQIPKRRNPNAGFVKDILPNVYISKTSAFRQKGERARSLWGNTQKKSKGRHCSNLSLWTEESPKAWGRAKHIG
jgi:hypothetical protein